MDTRKRYIRKVAFPSGTIPKTPNALPSLLEKVYEQAYKGSRKGAAEVAEEAAKRMKAPPSMLMKALKGSALIAGVGGALGVGKHYYDKYNAKKDRDKYFAKMLRYNSDLRSKPASVQPYFKSLMHFAPNVAADPLAAGSYVRRAHEFRSIGMPLQDVATLARIENDHSQARRGGGGLADHIIKSLPKA